jgi:acyl carrier protein
MMTDRKQLETDLMQFVRARGSRHASVTSQMDLLENGLLDSLLLVDLIFHIEEAYGVRFDSDQVNPSNFRTIEYIASFVLNQLSMPQTYSDNRTR